LLRGDSAVAQAEATTVGVAEVLADTGEGEADVVLEGVNTGAARDRFEPDVIEDDGAETERIMGCDLERPVALEEGIWNGEA